MIELRITGETPQAFLEQLVIAQAAMTFRGAVVNLARPAAVPVVGNVENENSTEPDGSAEHPFPPEALPPVEAKRGRKKKEDAPAPEAVEAKQAADEATDIPKDLEGMRALLGQLIPKFGVEAVNKIVHPYAQVLSKVPVENYPEIARLAHKKLAEDAA